MPRRQRSDFRSVGVYTHNVVPQRGHARGVDGSEIAASNDGNFHDGSFQGHNVTQVSTQPGSQSFEVGRKAYTQASRRSAARW